MPIPFRQIRNVALNCVPIVAMVLFDSGHFERLDSLTAYFGIIVLSFS